jgi:hypothetical protein
LVQHSDPDVTIQVILGSTRPGRHGDQLAG